MSKPEKGAFSADNLVKISANLEKAAEECSPSSLAVLPRFGQAIRVAKSLNMMRSALTEEIVREVFCPLKGTPLGFLTDEGTRGAGGTRRDYSVAEVRDVVMEAMIRGFRPVNNEFNMLAGRFYPAKAGLYRQVIEWPGLSGFRESYGVPQSGNNGDALVSCRATWRRNDVDERMVCDIVTMDDGSKMDLRIPVRVNRGMGPDAILGKAQRKLYARVFAMLSGQAIPEEEPELDPVTAASVSASEPRSNPFKPATVLPASPDSAPDPQPPQSVIDTLDEYPDEPGDPEPEPPSEAPTQMRMMGED